MKSKKTLTIIAVAIYMVLIGVCLLLSKRYIENKNQRLHYSAELAMDQCFNNNEYIVSISFSGEKVQASRVNIPEDHYHEFEGGEGLLANIDYSKEHYIYNEMFNNISRLYSLEERYKNDTGYTGYLFKVLQKHAGGIHEYTVYPKYIGSYKTYPSLSQSYINTTVTNSFNYYTQNVNSPYYKCFNSSDIYDIKKRVENKYYNLVSYYYYYWDSSTIPDYYLGIFRDKKLYAIPEFEDANEFGVFGWMNASLGRVYLECNPIDSYTLRYDFFNDPMKKDTIKIRAICIIALTLLLLLLLGFINRNIEEDHPSEFLT